MKLQYILICLVTIFFSCHKRDTNSIEEDYKFLFPWKGIEKPESSYEDMNIKQCNPNLALNNYKYIGVMLSNARTYKITLKCTYTESIDINNGISSYQIRYIGNDKMLKIIATNPNTEQKEHLLESGKEYITTFEVSSGFPMYLSVNGRGNRFSSVKAEMTATSTDGLFTVPILSTEQHQNSEGVVQLQEPYCEYIILP